MLNSICVSSTQLIAVCTITSIAVDYAVKIEQQNIYNIVINMTKI